ncbi:MAG: NUDIX hydrolase [Anaerolineales bacterium]|jgi:ADP-ribose pyrophosphatase YjhB (NUDIX family)
METKRDIRYQGAIIENDHILLIRWREVEPERSFWLLPGGGREEGETAEACLVREMMEETRILVSVERLLFKERHRTGDTYAKSKTYLCRPIGGEAGPGTEPEDPQPEGFGIVAVGWFDLRGEDSWDTEITDDHITYPQLQKIRTMLGYDPI